MGLAADTFAAAEAATSLDDLFLRLEAAGVMLRIDRGVTPSMAKTPTLGTWELDLLRTIERVVRLGHVRAVDRREIVLEHGSVPLATGAVVVHCAAAGLRYPPLVPIWQPDMIRLQTIRVGFPCFCAALAGYVEATRDDDGERNRLCPPNHLPDRPDDWADMQVRGTLAARAYGAEPDIAAWANCCALNPARLDPSRRRRPRGAPSPQAPLGGGRSRPRGHGRSRRRRPATLTAVAKLLGVPAGGPVPSISRRDLTPSLVLAPAESEGEGGKTPGSSKSNVRDRPDAVAGERAPVRGFSWRRTRTSNGSFDDGWPRPGSATPMHELHSSAVSQLSRPAAPFAERWVELLGDPRHNEGAFALLKALPQGELRALAIAGTRHADAKVRRRSCQLLDDLTLTDDTIAALEACATDPDPRVRGAALHTLACEQCKPDGVCVDPRSIAERAAGDRSATVRRGVAMTLSWNPRLSDDWSVATATRFLADPSAEIRRYARAALDRIEGQRASDRDRRALPEPLLSKTQRHPGRWVAVEDGHIVHVDPPPSWKRRHAGARSTSSRKTDGMSVQLNPYISFRDNAREAVTFYHSVFGGELTLSTFGEMPDMPTDAADKDKVMHAQLEGDDGLVLMAADTPPGMDHTPFNGSISLSGDDEAKLRSYWDKLSAGGAVGVPLEKAPWGDTFGMCTDRFGIGWMVNIAGAPA